MPNNKDALNYENFIQIFNNDFLYMGEGEGKNSIKISGTDFLKHNDYISYYWNGLKDEKDDLNYLKDHIKFPFFTMIKKYWKYGLIGGRSFEIAELYKNIDNCINNDLTVLILGDTGTGKELIAKTIHENSKRGEKPFKAINCGAIPQEIIESELFGHEKGAFTGAVSKKMGLFEVADKGIIFLDEIGEMSLATQVKLLRVLDDGEFMRVGSSEIIKVDIRIIASTNKDLYELTNKKKFRKDLYYRVKGHEIKTIQLTKVLFDEILLVLYYYLRKFEKKEKKVIKGIHTGFLIDIIFCNWRGNFRQLANLIEKYYYYMLKDDSYYWLFHDKLTRNDSDYIYLPHKIKQDKKTEWEQVIEKIIPVNRLLSIDMFNLFKKTKEFFPIIQTEPIKKYRLEKFVSGGLIKTEDTKALSNFDVISQSLEILVQKKLSFDDISKKYLEYFISIHGQNKLTRNKIATMLGKDHKWLNRKLKDFGLEQLATKYLK